MVDDFVGAAGNAEFNWVAFAKESQLLIQPELYTDREIREYVIYLLHDSLFLDEKMPGPGVPALGAAVKDILSQYKLNDGWMYSFDLYDTLKSQMGFENLRYFDLSRVPYKDICVQTKLCENKERVASYFRYEAD